MEQEFKKSKRNPLTGIGKATFAATIFFMANYPLSLNAETPLEAEERLARQMEEFQADRAKPITELQPFRTTQSASSDDGSYFRLVNLNPKINSWFLLEVDKAGNGRRKTYHLENSDPRNVTLDLAEGNSVALVIRDEKGLQKCRPWEGDKTALEEAADSGLPFAPLCDGKLYLRTKVRGSRTNLERTSEFLRDNVWFGESIVGFVKSTFFQDSHMESGEEIVSAQPQVLRQSLGEMKLSQTPVIWTGFGMELVGTPSDQMTMGAWYPVADIPGVYGSVVQPWAISQEVLKGPGKTNWLDSVEQKATAYFVAFDLSRFEIGYEVGTEHPRVDWSTRPSHKNWNIPGPDGIGKTTPVVNVGMVSPANTKRVVATFTGGFKRDHGAFRFGDWAFSKYGRHYGFVVHGVVQSKLHEGLATLYVLEDGTTGMKTWTAEDQALLPRIRFARQNGVAIIETDSETGQGLPGQFVRYWGPGNWSGSADAQLRTLRAGACMKEAAGKQFLVYGYFSTATPSAMARTFQAMGCSYAMLLDMNAPEHTYLAVYGQKSGAFTTQHIVKNMDYIDKRQKNGTRIPRFLGFSDNRDFFYLMKKED